MGKSPERSMLRAGVYYSRLWVPADVAHAFGKTSVFSSLRTRDPKVARSRLAQKTIEIEQQFDRLRQASAPKSTLTPERAELVQRAKEHGEAVADQVIIDQAALFERARGDSDRLWKGELTPLLTAADPGDDRLLYDRLVADGDFDAVIAFLQRFRLRRRIADLARMRATGNFSEFASLASSYFPHLPDGQKIVFARMLLAEELLALQAVESDIATYQLPNAPRHLIFSLGCKSALACGAPRKGCSRLCPVIRIGSTAISVDVAGKSKVVARLAYAIFLAQRFLRCRSHHPVLTA